jgi:predicted aconitase
MSERGWAIGRIIAQPTSAMPGLYSRLRAQADAALVPSHMAFVVSKRYNTSDPATLPFLTALAREGRRIAPFSPYGPGVSEAEQARIEPFLHNTDTRIDDALERPGPRLEIWQLDDPVRVRGRAASAR